MSTEPGKTQGRVDYLRLSITDRCNLRCTYCMPPEGVPPRSHDDILSYEELAAFARVAAGCGISKVRITGGEPLARLGCADFVGMLARTSGIQDISLTTNGILLPRYAAELRRAGLRRVNISLDSLDAARFARLTRGGDLAAALAGLDAAFAAGFAPVKVNALLLEGIEDELDAFVALTREREVHVRFIEFMPLDRRLGGQGHLVPAPEILGRLKERYDLVPHEGPYGHGPAQYWHVPGRARHHRLHRRRQRALLRELQPPAPHLRRAPAHLPLLGRGGRRPAADRASPWRCAPRSSRPCPARATTAAARRWPTTAPCRRSAADGGREAEAMTGLSHIDERGRARMVDVGGKDETERVARAEATRASWRAETLAVIEDEAVPKGDVVAAARLAGIMAAKRTHELIPLCHQLNLSAVSVELEADHALPGLRVTAEARLRGRTGVEMEALVAASVAALTIYDMCKAIDRGMEVTRRAAAGEERRPQRHVAPRGAGGAAGAARRRRGGGRRVSAAPDGRVVSVNVAAEKGVRKQPVASVTLVAEHGVEGDAHAGPWHRQVSLLANESIEKMKAGLPQRRPRRLRREPHHRGPRRLRAARRRAHARRRTRSSRSRRSARSATTAARSSTRPATA